jgi:hypothetical protein
MVSIEIEVLPSLAVHGGGGPKVWKASSRKLRSLSRGEKIPFFNEIKMA